MWHEENSMLAREFSFPDFKTALDFVNKVGELAEAAQHHPDIELGWGRVKVSLTTHDAGGVTDKDRQLAEQIDNL
jgi:4a-hydroxytetrahydrobiopterin dehydratase